MDALVDIRDLSLAFGGLQAIERVSARIAPHELVALIGPNGAGKTSLLNCVNGYYAPTAGSLVYDGRDVTGSAPHQLARLGIARAFQHVELIAQASVLDNVLVGRHVHMRSGFLAAMAFWGAAAADERRHRDAAEEILELLELEPWRAQPAGELPYGIQKRVGVARALALEPRLLLLDEPSSGMSRQEKEDLARFMLRIRHEKPLAMLWVEHDTQMVQDLADRVLVLDYGRKIFDGTPQAALEDPAVIEAYLGKPVKETA